MVVKGLSLFLLFIVVMVRKNTSLGTGLTILALLCLFVVMVVTLWPQYRPTYSGKEGFEVNEKNPSSYSLYTRNTTTSAVEFDRQFNIFKETMDDSESFYQFRRCYQFADGGKIGWTMDDLKNKMNSFATTYDIKIDFFDKHTNDINTGVLQEVKSRVDAFASKEALKGPVYMLITQAPYWRSSDNNVVTNTSFQSPVKLNEDPLNSKPYFPYHVVNSDNSVTEQGPIHYYVWIIYDRYHKSSTPSSKKLKAPTNRTTFTAMIMSGWDVKYFSKLPQCFMAGTGTTAGTKFFAGAGSKVTNMQPVATVTGPKYADPARRDKSDQHSKQTTFALLYSLNTPGIKPETNIVKQEIDCALYKNNPGTTAVPYKCTAEYWSTKCHNPEYIMPTSKNSGVNWSTASYKTIQTHINDIANRSDESSMQSCYGSLKDYIGQYIKDKNTSKYYYVGKNNSTGAATMNEIDPTTKSPADTTKFNAIKAKAFGVPNVLVLTFFKVTTPNLVSLSEPALPRP